MPARFGSIVDLLFCDLAHVGCVQFEEFASGMRHAADYGHAGFETRLVTAKIVADQFAFPAVQKVTSMLTSAAGTEVVDKVPYA